MHFTLKTNRKLFLTCKVCVVFKDNKFLTIVSVSFLLTFTPLSSHSSGIRACLHGGGGPQGGEVTRLGRVKESSAFTCNLTTRHPGVHFLKIIEWSLST